MECGSGEEYHEGRCERFEISHSASEYESLSGISCDDDRFSYDGAVSSLYYSSLLGPEVAVNSSFRVPLPVTLPASNGGRMVVPPQKPEKDLSGSFCTLQYLPSLVNLISKFTFVCRF